MQEQGMMGLGPNGEKTVEAKVGELADEQLANVSGGRWYATEYKVGDTCKHGCEACRQDATFTCVEASKKIGSLFFFDELRSVWKCENCTQKYDWSNINGWTRHWETY